MNNVRSDCLHHMTLNRMSPTLFRQIVQTKRPRIPCMNEFLHLMKSIQEGHCKLNCIQNYIELKACIKEEMPMC